MTTEIITPEPDCELRSSRIFNWKRAHVFHAWSDPELLKKWWGPAGFTNTFHEFDFKVGGTWRFIMHGPGKANYANECEFIKLEEPSLIAWKRISKPLFQMVARFEEVEGNRTRLVFSMLFQTAEECSKIKPFAVDKNEENFDRLENILAEMSLNET